MIDGDTGHSYASNCTFSGNNIKSCYNTVTFIKCAQDCYSNVCSAYVVTPYSIKKYSCCLKQGEFTTDQAVTISNSSTCGIISRIFC